MYLTYVYWSSLTSHIKACGLVAHDYPMDWPFPVTTSHQKVGETWVSELFFRNPGIHRGC